MSDSGYTAKAAGSIPHPENRRPLSRLPEAVANPHLWMLGRVTGCFPVTRFGSFFRDSGRLGFRFPGLCRLAEYLLRAPFSLEKITWNESTKQVIYRSERSWHTKSNFKIFTAGDFWLPPWSISRRKVSKRSGITGFTQTIRRRPSSPPPPRSPQTVLPAPPSQSARVLRPLWRDLIRDTWGAPIPWNAPAATPP